MTSHDDNEQVAHITSVNQLATFIDYSLLHSLRGDPEATDTGEDYFPRQVFSGHYVPVKPTPIKTPLYVSHSQDFFRELGFADSFASADDFMKVFSGDLTAAPHPMHQFGWATGYALSIYGTEYTQQCPFQTGNGYGDGRAVSIIEAVLGGKRWEMQLKGGGRTPYCRGADGRAVLRSSVREFLAQEHMHALGIATSRSLCLFVSQSETVDRPWYSEQSTTADPDIMTSEPVAITTRVAPSFLRVGQLELFARRARASSHPEALKELEEIVLHVIDREYAQEVDRSQSLPDKVLSLAMCFRDRLTDLVSHWIRVGYCQGNFNSDNCACGGFTLDYGPFGFMERFEPFYQPWTGGGQHFSFFNQPAAAEANFSMFCRSLKPLLSDKVELIDALDAISTDFSSVMQSKLEEMWKKKLGIERFDADLLTELLSLMMETGVDYTIFFRLLSHLPTDVEAFSKSFYQAPSPDLLLRWQAWLDKWSAALETRVETDQLVKKMLKVNPKYTWREWQIAPSYLDAKTGDFTLIHALQSILKEPYAERTPAIDKVYFNKRPSAFDQRGGISHYSCSS